MIVLHPSLTPGHTLVHRDLSSAAGLAGIRQGMR